MRNATWWAGGALALACFCGGAPLLAQTPDAIIDAGLRDGAASLAAGNGLEAEKTLVALTETPDFAALDPDRRSEVWALAAQAANRGGAMGRAIAYSDRATETHGPGPDIWLLRLKLASAFGDPGRTRGSLLGLATYYPASLSGVSDEALLRGALRVAADAPLDPQIEEQRGRLAEALLQANWRPHDPFTTLDGLRLLVTQRRLASGQLDQARRLAGEVSRRNSVISIRAERIYDGLAGSDGWRPPTPREASEAALIRVRALRVQHPGWLSGVQAEAVILEDLRVDAEALALVESALAQVRANPGAFQDTAKVLPWLIERQSRLLTSLNRSREAAKTMKVAANTAERGAPNVSQTLNFAEDLFDDEPREAIRLATEAEKRGVSPFGRSVALMIKTCAYAGLGQTEKATAALQDLTLLNRTTDTNAGLLQATLCLGDDDHAAAVLIDRFRDPLRRVTALQLIQVDLPQAHPETNPKALAREKQMRDLVHRPDVQAALEPYGRVLTLTPQELWRQ